VDVLVIHKNQVLLEAQVHSSCKSVESRRSIYSSLSDLMPGVPARLQEATCAGRDSRAVHCLRQWCFMFCSCAGIFKGNSDV